MNKPKIHAILLAAIAFLSAPCALGADPAPLPAKMKGARTNPANGRGGVVEAELVAMEGAAAATLKTIFWDGCTRRGESKAEFKEGAWNFVIPGGMRCEDVSVVVHPVEGKNRLEGEFRTGLNVGTIYFEW